LRRVETPEFILFARRVIAAAGRRVADGELEALAELEALRGDVDQALNAAVAGLRAEPNAYAWQAIGDELRITRQAAMQRFPNAGGARRPGGQPTGLR
jgi:hypothetical protein